mmetsp:Transcript_2201/g.3310  ORF Transcript_2201/g.3310 Transcript_2201/m.3310 type:complete len:84 (+) Transcript_2201:1080-1331(+)
MQNSTSQKLLSTTAIKVSYGSADLQGFHFEDYTCLNPVRTKTTSLVELRTQLKSSKCSRFEFLALYEAKGLKQDFHGILGLSP